MPKAHRDPAREQFWRQVLADWRASGRTIHEFCHERQLPRSAFDHWQHELKPRDQPPGPEAHLRSRHHRRLTEITRRVDRRRGGPLPRRAMSSPRPGPASPGVTSSPPSPRRRARHAKPPDGERVPLPPPDRHAQEFRHAPRPRPRPPPGRLAVGHPDPSTGPGTRALPHRTHQGVCQRVRHGVRPHPRPQPGRPVAVSQRIRGLSAVRRLHRLPRTLPRFNRTIIEADC